MSDLAYTTYMTDKIGPLPFCPGCGHANIVKALDQALVKLQPNPLNVAIVTDIGCIGLSDRYFVNAFHGLHGRAITYACGLKLARPDMTVIAIMGDGACGIGGTHLLNVSRRNIGIKLIIGNNFNYGMTGGQHSVTTPTGGITSDTPWGNIEGPMDLCATAAAAGAPWVCRATTFDHDLADVMAEAIRQPGFAMLDIWELCTAYYQPRNKLGKKELSELLSELGFKVGMVADKPRMEYSAKYKDAYQIGRSTKKKKESIERKFDNNVTRQTGIVIAGAAGQKIKSTASLFAEGAMFAGLNATQKDDYPITVQTGHSVAEIIVSRDTIEYTGIESPDYVVLLSDEGVKRIRARIENLDPNCVVYAEESLQIPETKAAVRRFPFAKLGKLSIVSAALGTLLEDSGISHRMLLQRRFEVSRARSTPKENLKVVEAGAGLVKRT